MKKVKTEAEKQYEKELRRVKQFVTRAKKRGYTFAPSAIPDRPKRITKASVRKLKKLTPDTLYSKAKFTLPTGEVVKGTEGRKWERKKSSEKAVESKKRKKKPYAPTLAETVLRNVETEIRAWSPSPLWSKFWLDKKAADKNHLEQLLEWALKEYGRVKIAMRLEENALEVNQMLEEVLYGSDENTIEQDFVRWGEILLGRALSDEENTALTSLQESQEDWNPPE